MFLIVQFVFLIKVVRAVAVVHKMGSTVCPALCFNVILFMGVRLMSVRCRSLQVSVRFGSLGNEIRNWKIDSSAQT